MSNLPENPLGNENAIEELKEMISHISKLISRVSELLSEVKEMTPEDEVEEPEIFLIPDSSVAIPGQATVTK